MSKILNELNNELTKAMNTLVINKIKDTVGEENADKYCISMDGIEGIDNRFARFLEEMLFFNAKDYSEEQLQGIKEELKTLLKSNSEDDEIDLNDLSFVKTQYVTNLMESFQYEMLRNHKNERVELLMALLYNWKDDENDPKSEDFCQG